MKTAKNTALAILACAASTAASAAVATPLMQRSASTGSRLNTEFMQSAGKRAAVAADDLCQLTVSLMLDDSRAQEVQFVLAISADPNVPVMYQLPKVGNVYSADIEAGVYDIVVFIKSDNENSNIFLFQEGEEINTTRRVLLNQRNATISTTIGRMSPGGPKLSLPEVGDKGNCSIADHLLILRHKDFGTLLQDETAAFRNVCTNISTNVIPKRFSLTRMDAYAWEGGPTFMVIPIDFNKDYNGPSEGGYQSVNAEFASTPMSAAWSAMQDPPQFAMTGYFIAADGKCNAYVAIGNYNHEFYTDRMYYWVPEDYEGYYEYYPVLRDGLIMMADASVTSMPYRMTGGGLVPSGLNLAASGRLMLNDGMIPAEGHPRFRQPLPEDARLANAVPALVCIPSSSAESGWDNGFQYDFMGRYGEQLGIDAYNFTDIITAEQLEQIGGYRRSLTVERDGTPICSSPGDFYKWLEWGEGEQYGMQLEMGNVLIDGTMEGTNKASLTYYTRDGYIPTVTALQLRDNDIVTDRFDKCDKATLELTAAAFKFISSGNFEFGSPASVRAEYAPHGSDIFTELTVTEIPENLYLPGYGAYYSAPLDNIVEESEDKWYDLRVTVEAESGAVQTQTLSPAFRLENTASPDGVDMVTRTGDYDVYSVDGRIVARGVSGVSALKLDRGIYVVKGEKSTRKVVIGG